MAARDDAPMSLRHGVVWTATGNGVYLGCQYAMLMALAKLGSPALVGQFSLALAVTAPVVVLSQMQLRQLQVTDVRGEYQFADYFITRIVSSVLALAVVGGVAVAAGYSTEMTGLISLVGLAKAFESLSDIVHGQLQRDERMDYVAASLGAKGILSVLLFSVVLWWGQSLLWATAVLALVWAAMFVLCDLPMLCRVMDPDASLVAWRLDALRRLAVLALPPALGSGLASLSGNIPRYVLQAQRGHEAVGFFSVAAAPLGLLSLLTGAVSQATLARAAVFFQTGRARAFRQLTLRISAAQVLIAGAGTIVFLVFGERLLGLLFTREYSPSLPVLVVMAAGVTVGGLAAFGSTVLSAGRMFGLQLANVVVMVLAQVPTCYYLVVGWGVEGAGWAEFLRYVLATGFLHVMGVAVFRRRCPGERS